MPFIVKKILSFLKGIIRDKMLLGFLSAQVLVVLTFTLLFHNSDLACLVSSLPSNNETAHVAQLEEKNEVLGVRDAAQPEESGEGIAGASEKAPEITNVVTPVAQNTARTANPPRSIGATSTTTTPLRSAAPAPASAPTPVAPSPAVQTTANPVDPSPDIFVRRVNQANIKDKDKVLDLNFENIKDLRVEDTSGYENHAKPQQGFSTGGQGVSGKAGEFEREGQYLSLNYNKDLDLKDQDFTISAWIQTPENDGTDRSIYTQKGGEASIVLATIQKGKKMYFAIRDQAGNAAGTISGIVVNDGKWHHVAGVRSDGKILLYVDGILQDQKDASAVKSVSSLVNPTIGFSGSRASFLGKIDNLRIYKRALSKLEIGAQAGQK